ncbi:hypothetical protein HanRHA438_Chr12g0545481 [Helianthus annuus]|nr:hypothetical protein HanRHA438_Chr12g0545481 [Helianthus annuus]
MWQTGTRIGQLVGEKRLLKLVFELLTTVLEYGKSNWVGWVAQTGQTSLKSLEKNWQRKIVSDLPTQP